MNFNSKRSVSDEQNERHKRILAQTLREEGNKSCADCRTRNPTWASVNLGVFVCLTCSGIHRSLGVHISQVRSCNLDTWLPKQVEFCRVMGNVKGNRYWEARLPKDFRRPPSGNPNPELASFIRAKYVDRAFAATDAEPPTIDNYLDNPYAKVDQDPSGSGSTGAALTAAATAPAVAGLRSTPVKPASSPALTMDLLGGFDEIATSRSTTPPPASSAQNGNDPFGFGSFVAAAAHGSSHPPTRTSTEWTDFHAAPASAIPPSSAVHAAGHQRSVSISEGVPTQPHSGSTTTGQASRFSMHDTHHRPAHGNHTHHAHHAHSHSRDSIPQQPASSHDPFDLLAGAVTSAPAPAPPPAPSPMDDLLAGLTIHHVMESFPTPASSNGGALQGTAGGALDPFAFPVTTTATAATAQPAAGNSSSSGTGASPAPGMGHKRKPSRAKEEALRLFDAEPSTGCPVGGSAGTGGSAASSDPFGDFFGSSAGVGAVAGANGLQKHPSVRHGRSGSVGVAAVADPASDNLLL